MAGQIKQMIDLILERRSRGNPTIRVTTRTKLILKGLDPDQFTATSLDDPGVIDRVRAIASELGVAL